MKRITKQRHLALMIVASTIAPGIVAKNNAPYTPVYKHLIPNLSDIKRAYCLDDELLPLVVQTLPDKSLHVILSEEELQHIGEVAWLADKLVVESQKTVDKMLDRLDTTPLSYFSHHTLMIIKHMTEVNAALKQHVKELSQDTPESYEKAINLSIDLFNIVIKYLKQLHAILDNSKVNTKAIKLAKALEKSSGALERVYVKSLKKLTLLIKHLHMLGLTEQVQKIQLLKEHIDMNYQELTDPAGASITQNMNIVYALDVKIEAEKNKAARSRKK